MIYLISQGVIQAYGKESMHTLSSSDRNEPQLTSPASSKPGPVRPLTAAYQAARSDHQVRLGCSLFLLWIQKAVLVPLRVFSLQMSKVEAFAVPLGY